jgi:hypothetical protein
MQMAEHMHNTADTFQQDREKQYTPHSYKNHSQINSYVSPNSAELMQKNY